MRLDYIREYRASLFDIEFHSPGIAAEHFNTSFTYSCRQNGDRLFVIKYSANVPVRRRFHERSVSMENRGNVYPVCKYDTPISISVYDIGRRQCPELTSPHTLPLFYMDTVRFRGRVFFRVSGHVCQEQSSICIFHGKQPSPSIEASLEISATRAGISIPARLIYYYRPVRNTFAVP